MPKIKDMTNWVMKEHGIPDSKITVLGFDKLVKGKGAYWKCKCECGNIVSLLGSNLRSGNTKSCGCMAKDIITQRNIDTGRVVKVGDRFGKLTVIADLGFRVQKSRNKKWRWSLCQCDCGSEPIEVANNLLLNQNKNSCGCMKSHGEFLIAKYLKENNVQFIREYYFNDLVGDKGGYLKFDFAIFENNSLKYLIEFDGRQHYYGPEAAWTQGESLETIQHHDNLKNEYCKAHNIILKRIPYYDMNSFTYDDIIGEKYNI